jgi:phosphate transport system substrate-binding protein
MKIARNFFPTKAAMLVLAVFAMSLLTSGSRAARPEASGMIRISGAWALYPMMMRWAEEYHKIHANVRIVVFAGGAGKGAADALGGLVDIGMVSRDIHPEEIKRGGFWISVVKDAVIPTANAGNPAAKNLAKKGLRRQQFSKLWLEGKALTWGDMTGNSRVSGKVNVYTRSDACGAAETWAKYLGKLQEDLTGTAVYGDPGVAEAVKRDKLGIGYNNLNYAYDPKSGKPVAGLMIVPIDINDNGKIDKAEDIYRTKAEIKRAIAGGVYPSPPARDLNLLTKGKPKGITREFLLWILGGGQKYVDQAGYIELPKANVKAAMKKLK